MTKQFQIIHATFQKASFTFNVDIDREEDLYGVLYKFLGRKNKLSYQTRCGSAMLSYNSGRNYHEKLHEAITVGSPIRLMKTCSLKMDEKLFHEKQINKY